MKPASLVDLCLDVIFDKIVSENIDIGTALDERLSNRLFQRITQHRHIDRPLNFSNLNVTEADFSLQHITWRLKKWLPKFKLKSLQFAINAEWMYEAYIEHDLFLLIDFLKGCLNTETFESLEHLSVLEETIVNKNYLNELLKLFPNLYSLVVRVRTPFCSFPTLDQTYDQLCFLDISDTFTHNLNGISKLKNLEVLIMSNLRMHNSESLKELFSLKKLAALDVSCSPHDDDDDEDERCKIIEQFLAHNKSLPSLRLFECSHTDMNLNFLNRFLELHDNLEKICLYKTQCSTIEIENVVVLTDKDLESTVQLLYHFKSLKRRSKMLMVLEELEEKLKDGLDYPKNREAMEKLLVFLYKILEDSVKVAIRDEVTNSAEKCLLYYSRNYCNYLDDDEKLRVVKFFAEAANDQFVLWKILLTQELFLIPGFDILYFYKRALQFIITTDSDFFDNREMIPTMSFLNNGYSFLTSKMKMSLDREILENCSNVLLETIINLAELFDNFGEDYQEPCETAATEFIKFRCSPFGEYMTSISIDTIATLLEEVERFDSSVFLKNLFLKLMVGLLDCVDVKFLLELWTEPALNIILKCLYGTYIDQNGQPSEESFLAISAMEILVNMTSLYDNNFKEQFGQILIEFATEQPLEQMHQLVVTFTEEGHTFKIGRAVPADEWVDQTVNLIEGVAMKLKESRPAFEDDESEEYVRNLKGNFLIKSIFED